MGFRSKTIGNKNAIKHKKGPPTFSDNPLKRIWPKSQDPLMDFQLLCICVQNFMTILFIAEGNITLYIWYQLFFEVFTL